MKLSFRVVLFALLASSVCLAETAAGRVESAATVLNEIMATPDKGIPEEILGSAKCVAVVPSLIKGGFVVGGAHGRGMATCRLATGWSAPAPLTTTGGSFGLQIGGQAVDVVMVVMNDRGRNLDFELWTLITFELWCRKFMDQRHYESVWRASVG